MGELYIGGIQVGRGYYNKPEFTSERFIDNPFKTGEKLYRTGDLVRWLPDRNLEFLGRTDHQVKIRGFRIELGEIESVLIKHESIKECAVIAREESGDKYLCAYVVCEDKLNPETLREYLKTILPDYMIPSYFIAMDVLPLTRNGKINLKALPPPDIKVGNDYVPPSNETEKKLVGIWSEVLTIPEESISVTTNFFSIGGHSLKATVLLLKMHKIFNVQVPLIEVFKKPTIKELGLLINAILIVENAELESNIEKERFVI
jgi:acyl carrier protein